MKKLTAAITLFLLAGCRGEKVPRDYQNMPPAVSHPVDNTGETPASGTNIGAPEPSSGAEGTTAPYEPVGQVSATPAPAATTT